MHDPRIGRFFAVDPLTRKYPYLTPYQFSSNQPIHTTELEGLESTDELNAWIDWFNVFNDTYDATGGVKKVEKELSAGYKKMSNYMFRMGFYDEMPRQLIYHFTHGKGKDFEITESKMNKIHADKVGIPDKAIQESIANGPGVYKVSEDVSADANTNGTLGAFTIRIRGEITVNENGTWSFDGDMQFYDEYDFDPKDWGVRSNSGEVQTRIANIFLPGKGFKAESKWVEVKQKQGEEYFDWFKGKSSETIPNRITPEVSKEGGAAGTEKRLEENEDEDENETPPAGSEGG